MGSDEKLCKFKIAIDLKIIGAPKLIFTRRVSTVSELITEKDRDENIFSSVESLNTEIDLLKSS